MLTALRAAAVLIIATGLNDVIAGAVSTYEPLYLYLAAVAVVAWLDGLILGSLTALGAAAFYALLFMPRPAAVSRAVLLPLGAALVTALVVGLLRGLIRSRRREAAPRYFAPSPPLLEAPVVVQDQTEVLAAIGDLREDLHAALGEIGAGREREVTMERTYAQAREALAERVHIAEAEVARLSDLLVAERAARVEVEESIEQQRKGFDRQLTSVEEESTSMAARLGELEQALSEGTTRAAADAAKHSAEISAMRAAADDLRRAVETERGRADAERGLRTTAVSRINELERALSEAKTKWEAAAAQQQDREKRLRARIEELDHSLADVSSARNDAERAAAERVKELQNSLERARIETEGARERVAELERVVATERLTHAAVAADYDAKLASVATHLAEGHESELAALRREAERASAQHAQEQAALGERATSLEKTLAAERAAHEAAVRQFDEKLAGVAEHLAASHDAELRKVTEEREAARIEVRLLSSRLDQLRADSKRLAERQQVRIAEIEGTLDQERAAHEAAVRQFDEKLASVAAHLAEDHESDLGQAMEEREAARAESRQLALRLADLQEQLRRAEARQATREDEQQQLLSSVGQELEAERSRRQRETKEHETGLAAMATRLASEYEADLARVMEERDAARAEAGPLSARIAELGAALEAESMAKTRLSAALQAETAARAELSAALEAERAAKAELSSEFDAKLNTIVAHLAEDHEADLGKALEAKEEARAEVRSLTMKLSSLQKRSDELEERFRHAVEDSTRLLSETRTAAQREIDQLRAQVASAAGPAAEPSAPLTISPAPRPRVLIAHPDADMRTSARASLERAGYDIVSASDGLEALRTAISQRPDVVIADLMMPKMDGRELCQLLKSQQKTAHIRVILLARASDEAPKGDLPPDQILRKPVPLETLKASLAALLAG